MPELFNELKVLFASDIFMALLGSNCVKLAHLNAAIALLIQAGIPFDLSFTPGTRRNAASTTLTIYINPTTTIEFELNFENGGSIFGNTT